MDVLLWLLIEFVVHLLGEVTIEVGAEAYRKRSKRTGELGPGFVSLLCFFGGFLLGNLSTLVLPRLLVHLPLAFANLAVATLLAGLAMRRFGKWREQRGHSPTQLATFHGGASLVFGTMLGRFVFG